MVGVLEFEPSRFSIPSPFADRFLAQLARHYRHYLDVVLLVALRGYMRLKSTVGPRGRQSCFKTSNVPLVPLTRAVSTPNTPAVSLSFMPSVSSPWPTGRQFPELREAHGPSVALLESGSERRSAVDAIGRFIHQSPGCHRQGTILAPVAALQFLPGSGAVSALGHFGTKTRPQGRSDATDSDAAGIDLSERGDTCHAERSQLWSRKRAFRERPTSVWRVGDGPGRRLGD
jgi:hypothetical protein